MSTEDVNREIKARRTVLEWMVQQDIRRHVNVAKVIREYYVNPSRVPRKPEGD